MNLNYLNVLNYNPFNQANPILNYPTENYFELVNLSNQQKAIQLEMALKKLHVLELQPPSSDEQYRDYSLAWRINMQIVSHLLNDQTSSTLHKFLVQAVFNHDQCFINILRSRGVDIDFKDSEGRTELMRQALKGEMDVVRKLQQAGADINVKDANNNSILMLLAIEGQTTYVKELLAMGADRKAKDDKKHTAVMLAARLGNMDMVRILWKENDIFEQDCKGNTLLMHAAKHGDVNMVETLCKWGANPNACNKKGLTALMKASMQDKLDVVAKLLEMDAEIDALDIHGYTAFSYAVKENDEIKALQLLSMGANIDSRDFEGNTAFMRAANNNQIKLAIELKKRGANPNLYDYKGQTPFTRAFYKKDLERAWELSKICNLDALNIDGNTLLIEQLNDNNLEGIIQLCRMGANVDAKNTEGETALIIAVEDEDLDAVQLLLRLGANTEITNRMGETALLKTYFHNHDFILDCLIQNNANIHIRNSKGYTLLMKAAWQNKSSIVKKLYDLGLEVDAFCNQGRTILGDYLTRSPSLEKDQMIGLLLELGADMDLAKEQHERLFFAQAMGISGKTTLTRTTRKGKKAKITFSFEGSLPQFSMERLSEHVSKFFQTCEFKGGVQARKLIENALKNYLILPDRIEELNKEARRGFQDILADKPIVILADINDEHGFYIVMRKDPNRLEKVQLIICDKIIDQNRKYPTNAYYSFSLFELNPELIEKLLISYADLDAFYEMIEKLNLTYEGGYNQHFLKIGNCGLANAKAAFKVLCRLYSNDFEGEKTAREFNYFFRQEVYTRYVTTSKNPDHNLIRKGLNKFTLEKYSRLRKVDLELGEEFQAESNGTVQALQESASKKRKR